MRKAILITIMSVFTIGLNAQEVISTQGDSYSNTNNTLDYTVGEPVIETLSNSNNDLTQGFHQTLLTIVGIEDLEVNFLVNIFPNPTAEIVNLDVEKYEGVTFHLFDVSGKLLNEAQLTAKKTTVKVVDYPKGSYLLTLTQRENKKIKTYKIVKK
jgi:hypothetical protein